MSNTPPRRTHINVWNGATNLNFKNTKVILSADQVDMFTDIRDFKSEGSTYIVNGSSVEGARNASEVPQGNGRPVNEGKTRTGGYGELEWTLVLLCGADGLLGFFHDDPHPNPPPPVGGYGQRTGRLLRPPP